MTSTRRDSAVVLDTPFHFSDDLPGDYDERPPRHAKACRNFAGEHRHSRNESPPSAKTSQIVELGRTDMPIAFHSPPPRDSGYDVAVVGGGPAGATCAAFCASGGLRTLLIEREKFPREKVCGDCLN